MSGYEKYNNDSPCAKELTKAVKYFIAKDLMPTSVVQGNGFRKLLEKLEPRYQLPSRKTLSERVIPTMYNTIKDSKVLPGIREAKYISLTSDCWTSRVNQSYISVTAHFLKVKSDWQFEHFVLKSKELPGSHTAKHLAEAIKECLDGWEIHDTQISCVTIDNASNIVKAVDQILQWPHLPCFGHTLNLAVRAGLAKPRVHQVVSKCSHIVTYFRRSSKATYVLKEKQIALGLPQHSMIQDVETRWNSTYNMLERICEQQASICASLVDLKRVDLMLQDGDVKIMEKLVEILKPFFQITETICGENYTTVSSIKPLLHHLLNTALDSRSDDLGTIKQLKEAVKQNLQQRYQDSETAKLLDIACFLDPRFKELPFLSVVEQTTQHNLVREEAAVMYTDILSAQKESQSSSDELLVISSSSASSSDPPPKKKSKQSSAEAVRSILADIFQPSTSVSEKQPQDEAESEIINYLREKPISVNSASKKDNHNPLEWWKLNSSRYKVLSCLATKYLCIPATSVPSERVFSCTGNFINTKRSCIHANNINMLYYLHNNL